MKTERIRLFAILLAALLMVSMLPVAAFAVEDVPPETPTWDADFDLVDYSIKTISIEQYKYKLELTFRINLEKVSLDEIKESSLIPASSVFKVLGKDNKAIIVYDLSTDKDTGNASLDGSLLTIRLVLKANSELSAGSYLFPFSIRLKKSESDPITLTFSSVYITVIGDSDDGDDDDDESEDEPTPTLTPHLVITSVSTAGRQLPKDENFSVTVSFKNTSKNIPLENIILTVAPGAGLTLPKASTNFYIEKIKAGGSAEQTFTLYADGDAVTSAFSSLGVTFSYQYLANDVYAPGDDSENVSLFFGSGEEEEEKEDRFDILDMETPDYLYPNEENYLIFTIINKGSKPINNIMGKIESPALSNNGASEYFGQLAANTKDELELPMVAAQSGDIIGTVTITYELEDGTEKMTVRDFTAYAEEIYIDDPGQWMPEEPLPDESAGLKPIWYFVGGGVLAAAGLTVVLVRRAKKKKAMALADDEI